MKSISRWASRHVRLAVCIIIGCEVLNAAGGVLLGLNGLESWPAGTLAVLALLLVAVAFLIQHQPVSGSDYASGRAWIFGAFLTNFLLFTVLGGLWGGRLQHPTVNESAWGSRRVVSRSDTLVKPASRQTAPDEYYSARPRTQNNQTGRRIGFVFLFLLGITLSFVAAAVACNLACAGNGVLAVIVLIAGIVAYFGGLFFLSRAFERIIKPWREMSRPERGKTNRRFLFIVLGLFALTLLQGLLANR